MLLLKEDWVIFENTHEAIIDKDTFNTIRKLREGVKRRLSIDGEMSVFLGLLYCADCGSKMYMNRHKGKGKDCFNCSSYRMEKRNTCFSHYITLSVVGKIALYDLQRVLRMAKDHEAEFIAMLWEKNKKTVQKETADIGKFMRLVKKYTEISELTPEVVRSFIDRILVHKDEKAQGEHKQTIESIYNCVSVIPDYK